MRADDGSRTSELRLGKPRKHLLSRRFSGIRWSRVRSGALTFAELGTRVEHGARNAQASTFGLWRRRSRPLLPSWLDTLDGRLNA